ncbi:hypothetical protein CABS03_07033 [Colletotrichum abscissum]
MSSPSKSSETPSSSPKKDIDEGPTDHTPKEGWGEKYFGGRNDQYRNGPPETGTGTQGGHPSQGAVAATRGGHHVSGASGHHSSSTNDISTYQIPTDKEKEADLEQDSIERQLFTGISTSIHNKIDEKRKEEK